MNPLPTDLRNKLERTIVQARDVAEAGAKAALEALAVHHHVPYGHMSPEERKLRNHLRARARQLGDKQNQKGELENTHLIWECAYEHWHRMLFARFLAENDLLIEPEMGVAISLGECEELAKEEGKDIWSLASEFAQRMLPQIFRPNDPVLRVTFASEHRLKLEKLLNDLESAIFTASDSLGWVYQFWQSKQKKEVAQSGNKIGADELPTVTQLFTEPYMVNFIIHNTLGAWWAAKILSDRPDLAYQAKDENELRQAIALPGISWEYLRFIRTKDDKSPWRPTACDFDGWPKNASELKILDPCCGSGHFLIEILNHLVPIRMFEDELAAQDAIDAVISENLYGLEIDKRCTQIATFLLALTAWKYPNGGGYRTLPEMNIACSGNHFAVDLGEWLGLAGSKARIIEGMKSIYQLFRKAPILGSLIDPNIMFGDLFSAGFKDLQAHFNKAIEQSYKQHDFDGAELGVTAKGIFHAAFLLTKRYDLIVTNVPYLTRGKQDKILQQYCDEFFKTSKINLATSMIERCMSFAKPGGTVGVVSVQTWLFQVSYKSYRKRILQETSINLVAYLGMSAFQTQMWDFATCLFIASLATPSNSHCFFTIAAKGSRDLNEVALSLKKGDMDDCYQKQQLANPAYVITCSGDAFSKRLGNYANSIQGIKTGDDPRVKRGFWEIFPIESEWRLFQSTVSESKDFGGLEHILWWGDDGRGLARRQGVAAWGKKGIAVSQMSNLPCALYLCELFDSNMTAIIPQNAEHLKAIYTYCISDEFYKEVRQIDQAIKPTNSTFERINFDLEYWNKIAQQKFPEDLPKPFSKDPTQWVFSGDIKASDDPLHVSVVRLLGYQWPNQERDVLNNFIRTEGLVCIPSVRGEDQASERLRNLLHAIYSKGWSLSKEMEIIAASGSEAKDLDTWLRTDFFEQHCKLFHHRPFIWHIWDGRRRDGFHALVNYHKLTEGNGKGRQLLESLTYSYLGDWIARQKEGVKRGEGGAEDRLAAALELQKRLIAIIEGEPPFDIFVRWKPIEEQPVGWEPDINDGVRMNIRPFMANDIPGGRKGAGILRWKPNIKWNKDRGKDVASAPWFPLFKGDRINDHHLSLEEKRAARAEANRR